MMTHISTQPSSHHKNVSYGPDTAHFRQVFSKAHRLFSLEKAFYYEEEQGVNINIFKKTSNSFANIFQTILPQIIRIIVSKITKKKKKKMQRSAFPITAEVKETAFI